MDEVMEHAVGGLQNLAVELANVENMCDLHHSNIFMSSFKSTEHALLTLD